MAGEAITIARPYAEALFARAQESDSLESWSASLQLLAQAVQQPQLAAIVADPLFGRDRLTELMLEIGGGRLGDEGQNLVRLLVQNDRLALLPEIETMFRRLKAESERTLNVQVVSAYALKPAQEKQIAEALKKKLGREITISSEKDPDLIGGLHIRAGDTVIDGSVRGQLQQLANELGI